MYGSTSTRNLVVATYLVLLTVCNSEIQPFELSDVRLSEKTIQARAAALNNEYLYILDPDRLLWTFRNNAKLEAPGLPYQGTWEDPNCEVRGQFMGHYLTALSYAWLSTGGTACTCPSCMASLQQGCMQAMRGAFKLTSTKAIAPSSTHVLTACNGACLQTCGCDCWEHHAPWHDGRVSMHSPAVMYPMSHGHDATCMGSVLQGELLLHLSPC